jgi:hypothetical protein
VIVALPSGRLVGTEMLAVMLPMMLEFPVRRYQRQSLCFVARILKLGFSTHQVLSTSLP